MSAAITSLSLAGKKGLILGLANEHSIAYGCARDAILHGAELVTSCLNEKALRLVKPLAMSLGVPLYACDVEKPGELQALVERAVKDLGRLDFVVHSIAWAPLEDLQSPVIETSGPGFGRAMEVSCHSFAELAKLCVPHMRDGGSIPLCQTS